MPHDDLTVDRGTARAVVASDLVAALEALSHARAVNRRYELGLELPATSPIVDAITATAAAHRKETAPT